MVKESELTLPPNLTTSQPPLTSGVQTIADTTAIGRSGVASPVEVSDNENLARRGVAKLEGKGTGMTDVQAKPGNDPTRVADHSDEDDQDGGGKGKGKSRRELPAGAVATLKAWLLSPEHFTHPYPTPQDQVILMQKTGIDKKQLKNWFTNARRRIWKPMLKKQLEQGKLQATGAGGVVAIPGAVPGMIASPAGAPTVTGSSAQPPQPGQDYVSAVVGVAPVPAPPSELHTHYQHALQQPQQQQQNYDVYGQSQYNHQQQAQQPQPQPQQAAHVGSEAAVTQQQGQYSSAPYYAAQQSYGQQQQQQGTAAAAPGAPISQSNSIGSLPPIPPSGGSSGSMAAMNKTDSHAVLMELFARDQDLVRQATESARLKAQAANATAAGSSTAGGDTSQQQAQQPSSLLGSQHPMKMAAQGTKMGSVPSLNSWPHFSSVSSLNNLGTMTGVKSITNMSGADLASQGNLNKKGNLAQVKSMESMGGRADSYAFLEVFFDNTGASGASQGQIGQRGVKRDREEDNDVGLSLDADESPSTSNMKSGDLSSTSAPVPAPGAPCPAPLPADGNDKETLIDSGTLKRAYDDALAARGLISVSRSCEKLTDLALPAKMQRTLSQEYLRQQMQTASNPGQTFGSYNFSTPDNQSSGHAHAQSGVGDSYQQSSGDSQQYPGQNPGQQHASAQGNQGGQQQFSVPTEGNDGGSCAPLSDPSMPGASVEVPATTKCALCHCINVDTQLRPCGHMFHGRCLKPSLQNAVGPPKCPIDHITMQSAVLAVPENPSNAPQQSLQQSAGAGGSNLVQSYQPNSSGQAMSEPDIGKS